LARCIAFGFKLVDQLIEPVEIDARPEPEGVWDGLRCSAATRFGLLAEAGTQCSVDNVLQRQA